MKELFIKEWSTIANIAFCCIIGFFTLFIMVRISGKRTLAKLNAFDFIVTVTLGSTLSSVILAKVTLIEGAVALMLIIILQYLLAWLARKSETMEKVINSKPSLLYYDGRYLEDEMNRDGITKEEIRAEVRNFRLENMEDVKAVVLELNGEMSVIKKADSSFGETSLKDLIKQ